MQEQPRKKKVIPKQKSESSLQEQLTDRSKSWKDQEDTFQAELPNVKYK